MALATLQCWLPWSACPTAIQTVAGQSHKLHIIDVIKEHIYLCKVNGDHL